MTEKNFIHALPLDNIEVRILGSLIEKQHTTPNQYPLTLNSLQLATNQKTSRNPIMQLDIGDLGRFVNQLIEKDLIYRNPFSSRAEKFEQRLDRKLGLTEPRLAILCVLMLRGDQTIAEIKNNSQRIFNFDNVNDVKMHLERMMLNDNPLVTDLPKKPGTKEIRFMHLLSGEINMEVYLSSPTKKTVKNQPMDEINARIDELETKIDELEKQLQTLVDPS